MGGSLQEDLTVTAWGTTIRKPMGTRTGAVRVVAFAVAATLSWSLWATCAEAASLTPNEQMACCKNGQHTCGHHGTPAECCKTAPQSSLSTAAIHKATAPLPVVSAAPFLTVSAVPFAALWHPSPLADSWSPPGSKHPTYLVLSILRL